MFWRWGGQPYTCTKKRTAMIHVCSLAALSDTVKATGASHVLTVMANVDQVQRPEPVLPANHLKVAMDDITEQIDGFGAPSDSHIERVLNFVRGWDRSAPMQATEPLILTASPGDGDKLAGLPFGPFDAVSHRTFEIGLRAWVEQQAGLRLGYVEQLYTFGDRGRYTQAGDTHVASIGYLALTRAADNATRAPGATFEPWYRFFPWEDWRESRPDMIERDIFSQPTRWAAHSGAPDTTLALSRNDQVQRSFGTTR